MSPYVLLDDGFHSNPKVVESGLDGAGLYARALSYCGHYLTDGYIGKNAMMQLADKRPKLIERCVTLGLFRVDGDRYWIRDYLDHNPSRAEVEARREQKRKAGAKGAAAKARAEAAAKADAEAGVSREAHTHAPTPKDSGRPLEVQDAATAFVPPVSLVKDMPA